MSSGECRVNPSSEPLRDAELQMTFDASIILVSDYKAGEEKSWQDLRKSLSALAQQDFAGRFEVLLIEEERYGDQIPPDLKEIFQGLKIIVSHERNSYALANVGVAEASAGKVILLDADCVPVTDWLASVVVAMDRYPDAAVVSGLTRYPGRTLTERCLALLLRSYVDPGKRGYISRISNNNAGYRRAVYLQHPLPTDAGVYASRLQSQAIQRAGWKLAFEPNMAVIHDFEGWAMERDIRQYMAHGLVLVRQRDPEIAYSWIIRLGVAGIPLFVAGRLLLSFWKCLTVAGNYGVKPWEVPYALALALRVHLMEIPGMLKAHRGESVRDTDYR